MKFFLHDEQPCLHVIKSQGSPDGSFTFCRLFRFSHVISFTSRQGSLSGEPWEGGWIGRVFPIAQQMSESCATLFYGLDLEYQETINAQSALLLLEHEQAPTRAVFCAVNYEDAAHLLKRPPEFLPLSSVVSIREV